MSHTSVVLSLCCHAVPRFLDADENVNEDNIKDNANKVWSFSFSDLNVQCVAGCFFLQKAEQNTVKFIRK